MANLSNAAETINKAGSGFFKLGCGLTLLIGVIIFFALVFKPSTKHADVDSKATTSSLPPIFISAKQYYSDYTENEVAADEKYKGRDIELTGVIESINKDFTDQPYLLLTVGDFKNVHCNIRDKNEVKNCKRGQKVTLLGVGATMIIGTPCLDDCTVIK